MYKLAVIGDQHSVSGFKTLGIDVFTITNENEARRLMDQLAKIYGIIFITEQIAMLIPDTITRYDQQVIPTVIPIPSNQGTYHMGMNRINAFVEKAVGTNIFREEDQS